MSRYVVMGVSGCGKSLIGQCFATAIGAPFIYGDSLHPLANIARMSRGEPLDDTDRAPWLDKVGETLAIGDMVVACSALGRIAANVMCIGCDPRQARPGMLRVASDRVNPIKRNTL
jgi:carbohydrate kinase (thermoresistant glucokinase family)